MQKSRAFRGVKSSDSLGQESGLVSGLENNISRVRDEEVKLEGQVELDKGKIDFNKERIEIGNAIIITLLERCKLAQAHP